MDENRDRLIDILLREELGGEQPPDLTDRIVDRAFRRRWVPPFRRFLLAASVLLAAAVLLSWFWPTYPQPRASGSYELVEGDRLDRGAVLRTRNGTATLELGGYCRIEIKPHSTLRIAGEPFEEAISLETGTVQCRVDREMGAFAVQTSIGSVAVTGTDFLVCIADAEVEKNQLEKRVSVSVVSGAVQLSGAWGQAQLYAGEERIYWADEKEPAARGGTVIGVVTAKEKGWIEVKADGEATPRRYVPPWVGGAAGGLDRKMLETIAGTPVDARVRIEWKFEERPRVVKLDLLRAPQGTITGVVTARGPGFIEVRADGEADSRRFLPHQAKDGGTDKATLELLGTIPPGTRVKLDWRFVERPRVIKIDVLSPVTKD